MTFLPEGVCTVAEYYKKIFCRFVPHTVSFGLKLLNRTVLLFIGVRIGVINIICIYSYIPFFLIYMGILLYNVNSF